MKEYNSLNHNKKYKILFVCLGNICRSVTAEEIFRVLARKAGRENQFEIDSAGIIDYHRGELADPRMREHAKRHGYILTHRSRPIVTADFLRFDLIVAMDAQNVRALKQAAPNAECCKKNRRDGQFPDPTQRSVHPRPLLWRRR